MNAAVSTLVSGVLAGAATCVGMGALLVREQWSRRHAVGLNALAAGMILGVAFLHLLPEATEQEASEQEASADAEPVEAAEESAEAEAETAAEEDDESADVN